jgi:pimeloyl-ACP methyl ester carboxylesterase
VRAIIQSARAKLNVDSDRVYVLGHSNGGFFAWFVAASLPDRVAAFAENAAGAVRCAHRAAAGAQFTGTASTCAALQAQPGFPTCAGALLPAPVPTRVPPGYLAHAVDDALVSVAWTCTLAGALGNRAWVHLQVPTPPDTFGHAVTDDFAVGAITFMTRYRRQD